MRTARGLASGIDMVRRYPVGVDLTLQRHPVWRTIVIALLGFIALASWGLSSPAGSSPDDDFHLTSIWCAQGERAGICENITETSVSVPDNVVHSPCFAFNKDVTGACQANLTNELVSVGRANTLEHSYPGGFYWTMSWFTGPDVTLSVVLMRLFNAALFVAMATATFLLVERTWRGPLALGVAVTIVPLGMFIIPSTNPSSWTLFAPAFLFVLARSLLHSSDRARTISIATATVAIAAISSSARSDAAVFAVFAIALAAIAEWRAWFRRPAFYVVSALIAGVGIWSLLAGRQTGAASGGLNGDATDAARGSIGLLLRNIVDLPGLLIGSLGTWNLGWLDTPMPSGVWVLMLAALCTTILNTAASRRTRRDWITLACAAMLLAAVPLGISQMSASPIGSYVQPRYVLPLLCVLVLALLLSVSKRVLSERLVLIITACVVVANAIALATNVLRYSSGLSNITSEAIVSALLSVGAGAASFTLVAVVALRWSASKRQVPEEPALRSNR